MVRLFNILGQLSPHSQVTVRELATEYEANERTIQRDIDVLRDAKLGVYYDDDDTVKISRTGYQKIRSWLSS
ncbi:MAG: HTH domain-containing protein [Candidatus Tectomicrobia bacterium]|nr:HTH domain-containing protein [Candidatus Tectomicrobia bacterium]